MLTLSYEFIDMLAENVLIDYFGTDRFPMTAVDIDAFARDYLYMDIRYEQLTYGDQIILGATAYTDTIIEIIHDRPETYKKCGCNTILLDHSLESPWKAGQRAFTLAHECGHHVISQLQPEPEPVQSEYTLRELHGYDDWREWQANTFASCILMPRYVVECLMLLLGHPQKYVVYDENRMFLGEKMAMKQLASELGVSFAAMMIRLKKLNLIEELTEEEYFIDAEYELVQEENPFCPYRSKRRIFHEGPRRAKPAKGGVIIYGDGDEMVSVL